MTRLMQFDPFNDADRILQQVWGSARQAHMPMDAYKHGDSFVVHLDLPGVDPASIDVSIEQNVLMVSAERHWESVEGDEVVCNERRQGQFSRQLVLGRSLDADNIHATYDNGVLTLTIPVAEAAKPRKIEIATTRDAKQESIPTTST
ncbi:MAG: Hsp20/alpha crystallin family protein [Acidimicrobiales bacterium]